MPEEEEDKKSPGYIVSSDSEDNVNGDITVAVPDSEDGDNAISTSTNANGLAICEGILTLF